VTRPIRSKQKAIQVIGELTDAVLLWQVACEFVAASRKLADQGFTPHHAWARLSEFLDLMPLQVPSQRVLERARELHVGRNWSYWDALLVAACLEAGVRRLYSEDLPGGPPPEGLEIINPFA
jgi:predicted nucleic acid-binding protein